MAGGAATDHCRTTQVSSNRADLPNSLNHKTLELSAFEIILLKYTPLEWLVILHKACMYQYAATNRPVRTLTQYMWCTGFVCAATFRCPRSTNDGSVMWLISFAVVCQNNSLMHSFKRYTIPYGSYNIAFLNFQHGMTKFTNPFQHLERVQHYYILYCM